MATLVQLRDEIILRTGVKNSTEFPPTRINRYINLAQRFVQNMLNGLGMKKWETSISSGTLSAGTYGASNVKTFATSVLTSMLESPSSIRFIETSDGTTKGIARPVDENIWEEQLSNTYMSPTLAKPVFCRISGAIQLAPSTITTATVHYYKSVTDLASDGDSTEIPLEFEQFVIEKAITDIEADMGKIANKEASVSKIEQQLQTVYDKFHGKLMAQNTEKAKENAKLQ